MRISFCKSKALAICSRPLLMYLSILFYEDFFLQAVLAKNSMKLAVWFKSFNPLLWGFLFARYSIRFVRRVMRCFQSSFMRISFCKEIQNVTLQLDGGIVLRLSILFYEDFFLQDSMVRSVIWPYFNKPFNPLLWGFLFARLRSSKRLAVFIAHITFQSSFMRISFCKEKLFYFCSLFLGLSWLF